MIPHICMLWACKDEHEQPHHEETGDDIKLGSPAVNLRNVSANDRTESNCGKSHHVVKHDAFTAFMNLSHRS